MTEAITAKKLHEVHFSSKRQDWRTPQHILELVRQVAPIGLDPCGTPDNWTGARQYMALPDSDGLSADWAVKEGELVYVNPPYGRLLKHWCTKVMRQLCSSYSPYNPPEPAVVVLTPCRADTRWFEDLYTTAAAHCFWRGRITFEGAEHPAPFPSVFWYWGPQRYRFCEVFEPHGIVDVRR